MASWYTTMARRAVLVAMVPMMFTAVGCKKKPTTGVSMPPPPPPMVERKLEVNLITPGTVTLGVATPATVSGVSFDEGVTVQFVGPAGTINAEKVVVASHDTINLLVPAIDKGGSYDVVVTNPNGESVTRRSGLIVRISDLPCKFTVVYFDLDKSSVRSDGKSTLDGAMSCINGAAGAVKVEGHCDERGTTDYNLALGQRRADSIKSYLTKAGVSASRISTISYGEDRPADSGHTEGAWAKNRRAEISTSP